MVYTLVLLRHGESTWNKENRFTGWTDVPLNETGELEAVVAGQTLKKEGYVFDVAFTSVLKRAIHTCWAVLRELDQAYLPVIKSWRLNERHYGALQGLNKTETAEKHGEKAVKLWRRSYTVRPPALDVSDPRWPGHHKIFQNLPVGILPPTECLEDTVKRVLPFWFDAIAPEILNKKRVLVTAHGNSLRGLLKHLDEISDEDIVELNIPTGVPLVYHLDDNLKPIKKFYLMDPKELEAKMNAVAAQGTLKK